MIEFLSEHLTATIIYLSVSGLAYIFWFMYVMKNTETDINTIFEADDSAFFRLIIGVVMFPMFPLFIPTVCIYWICIWIDKLLKRFNRC